MIEHEVRQHPPCVMSCRIVAVGHNADFTGHASDGSGDYELRLDAGGNCKFTGLILAWRGFSFARLGEGALKGKERQRVVNLVRKNIQDSIALVRNYVWRGRKPPKTQSPKSKRKNSK